MKLVNGRYNSAKIFTDRVEDSCIEQAMQEAGIISGIRLRSYAALSPYITLRQTAQQLKRKGKTDGGWYLQWAEVDTMGR